MNRLTLALTLLPLLASTLLAQGNEMTWYQPESDYSQVQPQQFLDCELVSSGVNVATGMDEVIFMQRPLFGYTHPQVKKYMHNQYLMEARAHVEKIQDNIFVIIEYKINSERAKTNYGNLEKDGKIKVNLINGQHLYLLNIERDRGKVKRNQNTTKYYGTYVITKSNYSDLKKHGISSITVLWEEGVEEYEVQNIDLIKNQLICLN